MLLLGMQRDMLSASAALDLLLLTVDPNQSSSSAGATCSLQVPGGHAPRLLAEAAERRGSS